MTIDEVGDTSEKPDGRKHVVAASEMLNWSGLVSWNATANRFRSNNIVDFGICWSHTHVDFGRLIHWSVFSIGAEYFAKGVSMLAGTMEPHKKERLMPPLEEEDLVSWLMAGRTEKKGWHTGTLERLIRDSFAKLSIHEDKRKLLVAGYTLLKDIRNRDLHWFAPAVREKDFRFVGPIFVPCLNILASCVPKGGYDRVGGIIRDGRVK
jgi:hypothetical protein